MPKKGKGDKLARMSDEERARYLQHRAELEMEAKRRKQQLIAAFTKNKLRREEAFSRLNTAKINEQWRFILRRIKCKELHEDVECLWRNFDRILKTKDLVIQRLYDELKMADMDHRRLQEAHIQTIDLIIGRYKQRCEHLHEFFARERDRVVSKDVNELNKIQESLEQRCSQLQSIIFGQEKEIENRLTQTKIRNAVNIYGIVYLKEDSLSRLTQYTSNEIEKLWRQLTETITEYENITGEDIRKQYEYLKEQDDIYRADAAQYPRLHAYLQGTIKSLKQDTHALSRKRQQRITELGDQVVRMRKRIESLRQDFSVSQMLDATQLKKLTIVSTSVLKDLRRMSEKGSALLSLLKMCSNLEPSSLIVQKYTLHEPQETLTDCISEPFNKLENFWEQFNYIKAENVFMRKECDKLSFENKQLRNTLRMYLLTVSRTSTIRPLMSVPV
ncbi:hypothetical protein DMN91_009697 [Ooceraea biroi]|uniref:Dynein regulatory complex subunit 2 n=1 Tax=Ooceraea biroi TaxID=2015173 RepID=A0A026W668_OOCBI|nr:dynein regulatory complex subunit 2 [Ooceraea biroi]EZA50539.1 Coiled-coil domain-containing protein [Ooceraea biroi]RLU17462.1 hypothetical protein DMN91_009697 [Ooceraea biroi]